MRRKKWLVALAGAILIIALLLSCAPEPAPPAPAPTAPPPPAPATPTPHPIVEVQIITAPTGTASNSLGIAAADIISKASPWLKVTARDCSGTFEQINLLSLKPELRSWTFIIPHDDALAMAKVPTDPFTQVYDGAKLIGRLNIIANMTMTFDPNIKTAEDLIGKKVDMGGKGSCWHQWKAVYDDGFGIWDQIDNMALGWAAGRDACLNDQIDATVQVFSGGPPWGPSSHMQMLMAREGLHAVWIDPKIMDEGFKKAGIGMVSGIIPAKDVPEGIAKEDITAGMLNFSYRCDESMDEEIVYEFTRCLWENIEKFAEYHAVGKAFNKEFFSTYPATEQEYHPGALKFFKEVGAPVGSS